MRECVSVRYHCRVRVKQCIQVPDRCIGAIREMVVVQTMSTDNPTEGRYKLNIFVRCPRTDPWGTPYCNMQ